VHPSTVFEHAATPHAQTRIVTKEKLEEFRVALRGFAAGIAQLPKYGTAIGRLPALGARRGRLALPLKGVNGGFGSVSARDDFGFEAKQRADESSS